MNNGDILTTMMNGLEQSKEDYMKCLYARAIHSNHTIQYHMQQIMEQQKVLNEYRSITGFIKVQNSFWSCTHVNSC